MSLQNFFTRMLFIALAEILVFDVCLAQVPERSDGLLTSGILDLRQSIVDQLNKKKLDLEKKMQDIQERENALKALEARIQEESNKLRSAAEELDNRTNILARSNDEQTKKVVSMLAQMKPKDAAKIVGDMDPYFAAGIFSMMDVSSGSLIMALLSPERSYAISAILSSGGLFSDEREKTK